VPPNFRRNGRECRGCFASISSSAFAVLFFDGKFTKKEKQDMSQQSKSEAREAIQAARNLIPFDEKKFHDEKFVYQYFTMTPAEFKAEAVKFIEPIEKIWFAKGRLAGLEEADREPVMTKAAEVISNSVNSARKSPEELAARAAELRVEAAKRGEELTHLESVRAAYKEAGVPV
jgi:hypothetical protein